jgi:hypothetical protein
MSFCNSGEFGYYLLLPRGLDWAWITIGIYVEIGWGAGERIGSRYSYLYQIRAETTLYWPFSSSMGFET